MFAIVRKYKEAIILFEVYVLAGVIRVLRVIYCYHHFAD